MKNQTIAILMTLLLGIFLVIFWLPNNRSFQTTGEIRAAIDIGSGATNLKVAKVDPKTNKIISSIFEKSIPVPYQKHLEQSLNQTFDREVMDQGLQSIKELKTIADKFQVKKVIAVATAAFRKATNAEQFAKEIEQQIGVQVRIINQDEEGILAFRAALAVTNFNPNHALTWDIGGGSMQLTTLTEEGTYFIDKGKTASIPFKNYVIQEIQKQDIQKIQSPNPISIEEMNKAQNYAAQLSQEVDSYIKMKLKDSRTQVLAVGSLFNRAIRPTVDNSIVHQNALKTAVLKRTNKSDAELPGGSLVEVAVTNPLLVLGYMKGLDIEKILIIDVNNADGALTYPAYW